MMDKGRKNSLNNNCSQENLQLVEGNLLVNQMAACHMKTNTASFYKASIKSSIVRRFVVKKSNRELML